MPTVGKYNFLGAFAFFFWLDVLFKYFLRTTKLEGNRIYIIILKARMYAHVKDNGSSSPKISQVETVSK